MILNKTDAIIADASWAVSTRTELGAPPALTPICSSASVGPCMPCKIFHPIRGQGNVGKHRRRHTLRVRSTAVENTDTDHAEAGVMYVAGGGVRRPDKAMSAASSVAATARSSSGIGPKPTASDVRHPCSPPVSPNSTNPSPPATCGAIDYRSVLRRGHHKTLS